MFPVSRYLRVFCLFSKHHPRINLQILDRILCLNDFLLQHQRSLTGRPTASLRFSQSAGSETARQQWYVGILAQDRRPAGSCTNAPPTGPKRTRLTSTICRMPLFRATSANRRARPAVADAGAPKVVLVAAGRYSSRVPLLRSQ